MEKRIADLEKRLTVFETLIMSQFNDIKMLTRKIEVYDNFIRDLREMIENTEDENERIERCGESEDDIIQRKSDVHLEFISNLREMAETAEDEIEKIENTEDDGTFFEELEILKNTNP